MMQLLKITAMGAVMTAGLTTSVFATEQTVAQKHKVAISSLKQIVERYKKLQSQLGAKEFARLHGTRLKRLLNDPNNLIIEKSKMKWILLGVVAGVVTLNLCVWGVASWYYQLQRDRVDVQRRREEIETAANRLAGNARNLVAQRADQEKNEALRRVNEVIVERDGLKQQLDDMVAMLGQAAGQFD